MSDKQSRSAGHDLEATGPDGIRNVVLVGPSSAGKTTLLETLLTVSGAIPRAGSVVDGTTVSDFDDAERAHGRSMGLAVTPIRYGETKINLIDTPGYADFVGEVRAGLRAADCALFVLAANDDVDHATAALWRECAEVALPRGVVVTKLDHARADFANVVEQLRATFGGKVLPTHLPVREGDQVVGLASLIDKAPSDDDAAQRGELIEGIIEESEDESLMDRYLGGEEIGPDVLVPDLERAMARGSFYPVVPVCATTAVGCDELLDLMVRGFPAPSTHPSPDVFTPEGATAEPIACDPDGSLVGEVVKTTSDPYVGRVSLVRVFSGAMEADNPVHVSGHLTSFYGEEAGHDDHDYDERVGSLAYPFGRHQVATKRVVAGDIALVGRLTRAETGDTLSDVDAPRVLRPWVVPTPLLPIAIEAETKSDEDKLSIAIGRLAAEDLSLRIENNAETGQLVIWTMGEAHADAALERLRDRFGVSVTAVDVVVPLRETFAAPTSAHGRHVKQSGGHGQYAVVDIEVEPMPQGAGFEYAERVVGGAVPKQFIPSVEKGVRLQMERGVRKGYPVVDIRVTLVGGKAHSVDSSDMAFQSAGALALREAAGSARVLMLEPYDAVEVMVPDDLVGTVMSDLAARRGRPLGTDQAPDGRSVISAHVPASSLTRYAVDLRSMTHGAGTFARVFNHYEPMPDDLADAVPSRTRSP
ncbi:MAG: elongation factor G-like protein EF-G2 [Actinomycetota bacterium]|nr:elongation factor G-like protein EF-G2 [Actinomycetota bacterium]